MALKMEKVPAESREKVLEWYESKDFGEIHEAFKQWGVYDPNMCKGCRNDNMIREWIEYAKAVTWAKTTGDV